MKKLDKLIRKISCPAPALMPRSTGVFKIRNTMLPGGDSAKIKAQEILELRKILKLSLDQREFFTLICERGAKTRNEILSIHQFYMENRVAEIYWKTKHG